MNDEEMRIMLKLVANEANALATSIEFDQLIKAGVLRKERGSYYTDSIHSLPEHVSKKISSMQITKKEQSSPFSKKQNQ